ncbi:hypothetical protein [Chryseobacterium sp. c4a]|uniref:hypothetical protein n=1 Tax=Chryseobacterium sp. c4a TaxID=1573582 RepID=UPI001357EB6F|nr:hypothetical protein [Chryseobacterium sp. c4a]
MDFKKIKYFFVSFLIAGFIFKGNILPIPYQIRYIIGLLILIAYVYGVYTLIYRPVTSVPKLKNHLLLRLGILIFFFCLAGITQWLLNGQNTNAGTGYISFLVIVVLGYALLIYTIIESLLLFTKKKYEQTAITLALAFAVYCFVIFSGLFGF